MCIYSGLVLSVEVSMQDICWELKCSLFKMSSILPANEKVNLKEGCSVLNWHIMV